VGIVDNSIVTLDTNCFIYYFEDNENYADKLELIFTKIQNGILKANMSALSLLEILVKPKKEGNIFLENRYKLTLRNYPNLKIVDVSFDIIDTAARLRATYNIRTPDAIILASSLYMKSNYFITNDLRLRSIGEAESINVILLDEILQLKY